MNLKLIILLAGATAMVAVLAGRRGAHASATIIVNTGTDESTAGDGLCSLREAINNANNPGTDTTGGDCNVGSGNDTIAIVVLSGPMMLGTSLPAVRNTLTIQGPGQTVPIEPAFASTRIFVIDAIATVVLNNLALEFGGGSPGGAIYNSGTLTVSNCSFAENDSASSGGAIANQAGTLNVSNSTFDTNHAFTHGGAIANNSGVVSISDSTFTNNSGGAIYNGVNQLLVITNSTFVNLSSIDLNNDSSGVLKVGGSILSGIASCASVDNPIVDLGYNIAASTTCGFSGTGAKGQKLGDGVDPKLDPSGLQSNGGPTDTIALQPTSPAIDAIATTSGQCPATDQRGFPRPDADADDNATPACDIGAFESALTPTPIATSTPKPTTTLKPSTTPKPSASPSATHSRTPVATPTPLAPSISNLPAVILVGSSFTMSGTDFTPGSVVNFFVATSGGPINAGPLTPGSRTPTTLTIPVPPTITLGQGFVDVQVVNKDQGFTSSNPKGTLLQGSAAAGIPSLTSINGIGLASTSSSPSFATDNVETVVKQGSPVTLGGTGFDTTNGVAVDLFCACTGGKVGPFFINPGPGLTSTSISLALPATGSNSPSTGPGSFVISNAGTSKAYDRKSNAVSVPIGEQISVTSVTRSGSTIMVNGTGFSTLTVINFFNTQTGGVVNLGGLGPRGSNIPLTFVSSHQFTFAVPADAVPGASYVQALNPPFVPFSSSGNAPGGAFTLK